MTIEEAMHELKIQSQVLESMILYNKDFEPKNDNTSLENKKNAIDIGIKALEKQIPKKPYDVDEREENSFYYLGFMCPSCNKAIVGQPYRPNYCKHCGQKIDWKVEE